MICEEPGSRNRPPRQTELSQGAKKKGPEGGVFGGIRLNLVVLGEKATSVYTPVPAGRWGSGRIGGPRRLGPNEPADLQT